MEPQHSSALSQPEYSNQYMNDFFDGDVFEEAMQPLNKENLIFRKKLARIMNIITVATWMLGFLLYFL